MQTEIDVFSSTFLGKMQLFLDEDIKYLNGSYNTRDGKYFSGKGVKILRNNISANVTGCLLECPSYCLLIPAQALLSYSYPLYTDKDPFSWKNLPPKNTPNIPVSSLKLTLNLENKVLQFLRSS